MERSSPIMIEQSNRLPHRLINYILAYIVRDKLGYVVDFNEVKLGKDDSLSGEATLCRLSDPKVLEKSAGSCKHTFGSVFPESMINCEVWLLPGFNVENWVRSDKVIDSGPLGPFSRYGLFVPRRFVDETWTKLGKIADHFRSLTDANLTKLLNFKMTELATQSQCK